MPLQNRVDPWGTIFRSHARGTMMGNRGPAIHNEAKQIVRQFNGERWLICVLEFKERRRTVMSPGFYTELFFLDEAVALAAGHRPCAECRRERFNAFRDAWPFGRAVRAPDIDAELHAARIDKRGEKVTYAAPVNTLPDGCFVQMGDSAYLVNENVLLRWAPEGYTSRIERPDVSTVTVLTPKPVVECLRAGYRPQLHLSAARWIGCLQSPLPPL